MSRRPEVARMPAAAPGGAFPSDEPARKEHLCARLYTLAQELEGVFQVLAHPSELPKSARYDEAVRILVLPGSEAFARRLVEMYRAWAARRRMRIEELEERSGADGWRWTAAISGYGAFLLLEPEAGLHVLEFDGEGGTTHRHRVRVRLAAQPDQPLEDAQRAARAALAADAAAEPRVVRRYREAPSPLVRDAVRGWRTGRIERVWAGDFDLVR